MRLQLLLNLFFAILWGSLFAKEPLAVYVTALSNPSFSMTVQWITDQPETSDVSIQKGGAWLDVHGQSKTVDGALTVHTLELVDLEPDTLTAFRFPGSETTHTFRTLPKTLKRPVHIAIGGDAYQDEELFAKMNRTIAALNPDLVIVGGDIAYTERRGKGLKKRSEKIARWVAFFQRIQQQLRAPDGRLIPLIPVIGNHDIAADDPDPLLFKFFAFPREESTYRSLDIGAYASFLLLDTNHKAAVLGPQSIFVKNALLSHAHTPHLFAVYHVAAYPTFYSFNATTSQQIRAAWVPLFEEHHITAAFENHNHTYKRTHPLLQGKPHRFGIPYLGDGSWGVPPRRPKSAPYIATSKKLNAIWLLTLNPSAPATLISYTNEGTPLETLPLPPRPF